MLVGPMVLLIRFHAGRLDCKFYKYFFSFLWLLIYI